jgi:hypothetical protein
MRTPCCLCVCMYIPTIVARQRLVKHVPAARHTHATIEELLDASFYMRLLSHQRIAAHHRTYCIVLKSISRLNNSLLGHKMLGRSELP